MKNACQFCGLPSLDGEPCCKKRDQHNRVQHLRDYLKSYTDRGATIEGAALNYVREFPARLHLVILALMEMQR